MDYLNVATVSYCASVMRDGKEYQVSTAVLKGNLLKLELKNAGVTAELDTIKSSDRIELEVVKVKGQASSLTFINVPLKFEGPLYEPFAACVLSNEFIYARPSASRAADASLGKLLPAFQHAGF